MDNQDILHKNIKDLIFDEEFSNLQIIANDEINFMQILGVSHKELQHSNFLA